MYGIEKFSSFEAITFGRTLVFLFQHLVFFFEGISCGIRKIKKDNFKEEEEEFN